MTVTPLKSVQTINESSATERNACKNSRPDFLRVVGPIAIFFLIFFLSNKQTLGRFRRQRVFQQMLFTQKQPEQDKMSNGEAVGLSSQLLFAILHSF